MSRVLQRAETALLSTLLELPDAGIRYPTKQQQRAWAERTEAKEPLVKGVWGFINGKNYRVKAPTDPDRQNAEYNGWLHSVLVTGTLCFGVDGTVVWARHNYPGSWNDGETSRQFQLKLGDRELTEEDTGVVADSAFPMRQGQTGKVLTPLKDCELARAPEEQRLGMVAMSNAIIPLRQAAEWGMGAPSRCYRILLLPLPYSPALRGRRLEVFRLYNFRTRQTGISQIRSVFM